MNDDFDMYGLSDLNVLGCYLQLTCSACPEQYDVYLITRGLQKGQQIGYLRLRHGNFTAEYSDCGGKLVYSASPSGDGCFDSNERETYLTKAVTALLKEYNDVCSQLCE